MTAPGEIEAALGEIAVEVSGRTDLRDGDGNPTLTAATTFGEVGLDSLALVEVALAIEDRYGVRLYDRLGELGSIAQTAELVAGLIPEQSAQPK